MRMSLPIFRSFKPRGNERRLQCCTKKATERTTHKVGYINSFYVVNLMSYRNLDGIKYSVFGPSICILLCTLLNLKSVRFIKFRHTVP